MIARLRLPSAAILLATTLNAGASHAAPVAAGSNGQATIFKSFTVVKRTDLDFGALVPLGAGTAVINPVTGALTTTGLVTPVGSSGQAATFTTTGSRNTVVIIKVPNGTTTLTRVGGGATMTVNNWTLDGAANRRIPASQMFDFKVGGTLNIAAGQLEGTYSGSFTITVNHP